ncbi:MAG: hypothetical protein ACTSRC_17875 [Candidatus Helarchaeota archaeon]
MPHKDEDEVSQLESEVENVLQELSSLEIKFEDVLKPKISTGARGAIDANYLVAVRRFQNGMRVSLMNGAETGNKETFDQGIEFYNGALTILKANSDYGEIQQLNNELIQTLVKIITKANSTADESAPYGPYFLFKSCQKLASVYETTNEYELAMKFHDRAATFSRGLVRELELLQKLLDALLSDKISLVQQTIDALQIKHVRGMGALFLQGYTKKNLTKVESAQNFLETLAAQRNLSIDTVQALIEKLVQKIRGVLEPQPSIQATQVPAPSQSMHLSDNIIGELRNVLTEGIQQLKSAQGGGAGEKPVIDTSSIISEIKNVISEEIKTISSEIVTQIVNKLPVGLPSGPRAHSGGAISDDVPDIKIAAGPATGERQPRPKLDDMLDSIIVSE